MIRDLSIAILAIVLFALCGCRTGNMIRFEQRSVAGITTMEFAEWTVPIVSISSGPSFSLWQNKDVPCKVTMMGFACTTNTTSALGIYNSAENKQMQFSGTYTVDSTNTVNVVK